MSSISSSAGASARGVRTSLRGVSVQTATLRRLQFALYALEDLRDHALILKKIAEQFGRRQVFQSLWRAWVSAIEIESRIHNVPNPDAPRVLILDTLAPPLTERAKLLGLERLRLCVVLPPFRKRELVVPNLLRASRLFKEQEVRRN